MKQVSEKLGVRYVLEGSIQRSGDHVRINAQLIDALSGNHLWAERYDRELKDIFALQDEMVIKILNSLQMKLSGGDIEEVGKFNEKYFRGPHGLDCYLKFWEAFRYIRQATIESNNKGLRILEDAVAMCPENPLLYSTLASSYVSKILTLDTNSPQEAIEKIRDLSNKAMSMDNSWGHVPLCWLYLWKKDYEKAIAEGEKVFNLAPWNVWNIDFYGMILT